MSSIELNKDSYVFAQTLLKYYSPAIKQKAKPKKVPEEEEDADETEKSKEDQEMQKMIN